MTRRMLGSLVASSFGGALMNRLLLSVSAFALLLGGCGGGGAAGGGSAVPLQHGNLPGFLRVGARTPAHPPQRRHQITGADRARARAGGWQPIASTAPFDSNGPGTAMLMTDGTVMVQDSCSPNWFSLAPDSTGNYVTGKSTKKASMPSSYGPLYFESRCWPTANSSSTAASTTSASNTKRRSVRCTIRWRTNGRR